MGRRFGIALPKIGVADGAIILAMPLFAGLVVALFLFRARLLYGLGFPLDDAWIHQTYARNLAAGLGWVYRAGLPSSGATAPLWVMVIACGHLLHILPLPWVVFIGWLTLSGFGWLAFWGWKRLSFNKGGRWLGVGLAFVLLSEWHVVWASLSGMETALFSLLIFWGMLTLAMPRPRWLLLGLLIGFGIWLRPEMVGFWGIALLGWVIEWRAKGWCAREWRDLIALLVPPLVSLGLLLAFNYHLSGRIWQNTFYAKQAEYASLRLAPLWKRWVREAGAPLVGVNSLLVLGLVGCMRPTRFRQCLLPLLWAFGHITVYAVRLPVVYQHARYLIPVVPVVAFWGALGWGELLGRGAGRLGWVVKRGLVLTTFIVALGFLALGANAYAHDVALIETEMVATARWGAKHLPPGARVGLHDIGAWGYFTQFPLIDIAGLVNPEVIPIIRSETDLRDFLNSHHADVLVTFPDWYPHLTAGLKVLYFNPDGWGTKEGGSHLTVYRWRPSFVVLYFSHEYHKNPHR